MSSVTSAAACKWSSQQSGVLVNLYYWIIIIWQERREEIMHSCYLYCYNMFVQCFPNDNFMIGLYEHLFPIFITEEFRKYIL